jgi:Mechanosensitive ion channel, conserved TM helix
MSDFLNLILEPLQELFQKFKEFAPNFLAMLVILLVGALFAWLLRKLIVKLLVTLHFDSWSDRKGFTTLMRKGDMWGKPSLLAGEAVFWVTIIVALMTGLSALNINAIDQLVTQFFTYLPRAFSAILILGIGYIFAGFVSRAVLITAVNSGYHYAKLLAEAIRILFTTLILAMVMEQLQIAPGIVLAAFSIICGGIVLALSISFGVGGIDAARRMIERQAGKEDQEPEKEDIEHL